MRVLVTGSSGMLGMALCDTLSRKKNFEVAGIDIFEPRPGPAPESFIKCDITDYDGLRSAVRSIAPEFIVHAAAYTDVDGCETDNGKAEAVNGLGTRYIAEAASNIGAGLVYVSTDFVFDGRKKSPYKEDDHPDPLNAYGRSKLDGERFVEDIIGADGDYFIVRSSWLFGVGGKNFVDTILRKAQAQKEIRVVSDQFGSPTYAPDLARAIIDILKIHKEKKEGIQGIYHVTNSDDCSWYRLAQKSLRLAGIYDVELIPIVSEELSRPARRPRTSILDNGRFENVFDKSMRRWEDALEEYIALRKRSQKG